MRSGCFPAGPRSRLDLARPRTTARSSTCRGCTALALSQSGRTPDVVEYARQARRRGAYVVAFTNDPASALAHEADAVLALNAGPELAVAATKTYLNQVAALGLLAAHAAGEGERSPRLRATVESS